MLAPATGAGTTIFILGCGVHVSSYLKMLYTSHQTRISVSSGAKQIYPLLSTQTICGESLTVDVEKDQDGIVNRDVQLAMLDISFDRSQKYTSELAAPLSSITR